MATIYVRHDVGIYLNDYRQKSSTQLDNQFHKCLYTFIIDFQINGLHTTIIKGKPIKVTIIDGLT